MSLLTRRLATVMLMAALVAACGQHGRGQQSQGGPPMPVVPTSQQQAQDTVLGYLKKTLTKLPAGTTLDATRYSGATSIAPCEDVISGVPSEELSTDGDLKLPSGADPVGIVATVGDIWKSWGWHVIERDGFYKPNRFGYAPDGYSLQIMAASRPGFPPSLVGVSPCFPGNLPANRSPFPIVLTSD